MDTPSLRRRNYKWAMVSQKGGKCVICGERVTVGNIESYEFDHKIQVNNHADKTDRWGGGIRDWPPFTEKWFAWADTVDLICEGCHRNKHKNGKQSCLLESLEFQAIQERLDAAAVDNQPFAIQAEMFG